MQTTIWNLSSSKWNSGNVFRSKHSLYVKLHFRLTITIAVLDKMCAGKRTVYYSVDKAIVRSQSDLGGTILQNFYHYYDYYYFVITLISTERCSEPTWCLYIVLLLFQDGQVHLASEGSAPGAGTKYCRNIVIWTRRIRICKNQTSAKTFCTIIFPRWTLFPMKKSPFWKVLNKKNPIHHWIGIG